MRLIHAATAFLLSAAAFNVLADGGYCEVPLLSSWHAVEVHVPDVSKGLCGAARIGNRVVRVDVASTQTRAGPIVCGKSDNDCWRRVEYVIAGDDDGPYVVILRGPKRS